MKKTLFLMIITMALAFNVFSKDILIGHAYYFKCPYHECDDAAIYARPLFKKTQNGWQVFPNGEDIGNTPYALEESRKLFPDKIKWNIFNYDQSLIGREIVENKKTVEWWMNVGAAPTKIDVGRIKQDPDVDGYAPSADLILATNRNVAFSKFKARIPDDIKEFESYVKNVEDFKDTIKPGCKIEKHVAIYTVDDKDVVSILDFTFSDECEIYDTDSVVLAKTGNRWEIAFDGKSIGYNEDAVSLSLSTIADFDNDGKSEYIFFLSSGVNKYGYILWQDGMKKPLVYKFFTH